MLKRLLVTVLVLVSMVTTVAETGGAAGVPQDLEALTTVVKNGFAAIQNALSDIQNSLNTLSTAGQSNVRFTPPVFVIFPDHVACEVVNVSGATQTVLVQLMKSEGTVLTSTGNVSLAAGHATQTDLFGGPGSGLGGANIHVYCKFTVVGGSRTDIRGSVVITDKLALPAE